MLQENVTNRCDELVEEIISPNRQRKIVEAFDELSDTLCKVADMTEFVRLTHPSSIYSQAAEEACFEICKIVEKCVKSLQTKSIVRMSYNSLIFSSLSYLLSDLILTRNYMRH